MSQFRVCIVLIILAVIFGIGQCSDACFYQVGQPGKKCFDDNHNLYTCCPANDQCENGRCSSLDAASPGNGLPLHVSILLGIGACVFVLICIVVIGAIYWRREEMNIRKRLPNSLASFSRTHNTPDRTNRFTNPQESTSTDGTVNLKIHSTMKV